MSLNQHKVIYNMSLPFPTTDISPDSKTFHGWFSYKQKNITTLSLSEKKNQSRIFI